MNLISVVSNNFDALITVVVLIMSIILFIKNTIAPELTGLLCVGIFIATGVLSPEKALAGFGSPFLNHPYGFICCFLCIIQKWCLR